MIILFYKEVYKSRDVVILLVQWFSMCEGEKFIYYDFVVVELKFFSNQFVIRVCFFLKICFIIDMIKRLFFVMNECCMFEVCVEKLLDYINFLI